MAAAMEGRKVNLLAPEGLPDREWPFAPASKAPAQVAAMKILVCGDAMWDEYYFGEVDRISPEAPILLVRVLRRELRHGAADNVIANCVALGAETCSATINTARKVRVVARNQQIVRLDFDETPPEKDVTKMEYWFRARLEECKVVIFSDYGRGSLTNIKALIAEAKAAGKTVLVDPKGHDYTRYSGADMLKPNINELRELMGGWGSKEQMEAKAQLLRGQAGVKALLLTQAVEGMTLFTEGNAFHVESQAREVFDVTGAGDTAIATFAVALNLGHTIQQATEYANKAAGIVCGKFGTSVATKEEVFGA